MSVTERRKQLARKLFDSAVHPRSCLGLHHLYSKNILFCCFLTLQCANSNCSRPRFCQMIYIVLVTNYFHCIVLYLLPLTRAILLSSFKIFDFGSSGFKLLTPRISRQLQLLLLKTQRSRVSFLFFSAPCLHTLRQFKSKIKIKIKFI